VLSVISIKMMMNTIYRDNNTKRRCVEDKQKRTEYETLRNSIQKLENRRPESLIFTQRDHETKK
jgi:uncharacterized SAM-binding protein YcdF (DUF218 family)